MTLQSFLLPGMHGNWCSAPQLRQLLRVMVSLQGGECFGYFMQWGLPKATLKDLWELVAGDEGRLTQRQFVSCIYLMERAKTGAPLPKRLPPGPFPPVAQSAASDTTQRAVSLAGLQGVRPHWPPSSIVRLPGE